MKPPATRVSIRLVSPATGGDIASCGQPRFSPEASLQRLKTACLTAISQASTGPVSGQDGIIIR